MGSSFRNQTYYLLVELEKNCLGNMSVRTDNDSDNSELFCPTVFDGIMCWKRVKAGKTVHQSCSSNNFLVSSYEGLATLVCEKTGKWFTKYKNLEATANYTQCGTFYARDPSYEEEIYTKWLPILRKCTHFGYAISIISLLLALLIFIYLKRLHCARNYLHMHLFVSSILRCSMSILKDLSFVKGTTLFTETSYENGEPTFRKEAFWCKAICYCRLGIATLICYPWIVLRIVNGSIYCWTTKDKTSLLIEIPTGVIVVINFILFILIVRILCLKLNSMFLQQRRVKYRKLVKATLILLPLFGVPYTISVILSFYVTEDKTLEIVWLFFDQSFTAFQGFLAALAYCLLNSDVQSEIKRRYRSIRENKELRRSRTISHTLQSVLPSGDDLTEIQQCTIENGKLETEF
ncbi:hypothetical protein HHI36_024198 [Cryptolaemus montrouzieri]|uniref:Parathyroid hormone/parathyroid hormone-related peptide receptor n=1 Tax=Cryptolaemus montrouzieri TaxID=559131 RepID=A0ABD2NBX1_9CUCU